MVRRIGLFQRTVLKGIKREGKQPAIIRKGFSKQVISLKRRKLIVQRGRFLFLTKKGRMRLR